MTLPPHISRQIREVIGRKGGFPIDEEDRSHDAIALMGTIGSIWMLRADGTLWDADADFGKPLTPLPDELRTTAVVAGVERFPWLAELLPAKPPDAVDCAGCAGRGVVVPVNSLPGGSGFFCPTCQALGWLSPSNPALNATSIRPAVSAATLGRRMRTEKNPPSAYHASLLTFLAAITLGLVATFLNNVTFATNDYTSIVLQAFAYASLALVLTALSWRRSSFTRRIVLLLFALGDLHTLMDAGGRRLPAILHW
jgi:hypothetical protein